MRPLIPATSSAGGARLVAGTLAFCPTVGISAPTGISGPPSIALSRPRGLPFSSLPRRVGARPTMT
eukprot:1383131-Lingulodinium_polyedra.AAC.1